jgi:hypothetical protein
MNNCAKFLIMIFLLLSVTLSSEMQDLSTRTFETWITVNGDEYDKWHVNTIDPLVGIQDMCVSSSLDTDDPNTAMLSIVHIYMDLESNEDFKYGRLKFRYGKNLSNNYENYLRLYIVDQNFMLTAGEEIDSEFAVSEKLRSEGSYEDAELYFECEEGFTNKRLVFSWVNKEYNPNNNDSVHLDRMVLNYFTYDEPPAAVVNLLPENGEDIRQHWVKLSWDKSPIASDYLLSVGTNPANPNDLINEISTNNESVYFLADLNPDTNYYWKVVPVNSYGIINEAATINNFETSWNHYFESSPIENFETFEFAAAWYGFREQYPAASGNYVMSYRFPLNNSNYEITKILRPTILLEFEENRVYDLKYDLALSDFDGQNVSLDDDDSVRFFIASVENNHLVLDTCFAEINYNTGINPSFLHFYFELSNLSGKKCLVFEFNLGNGSDKKFYLDNFCFKEKRDTPFIEISASTYDYRHTVAGLEYSSKYEVRNYGGSDLIIEEIISNYQTSTSMTNNIISPSAVDTLYVNFQPTELGVLIDTITISCNAENDDNTIKIYSNTTEDIIGETYHNPINLELNDSITVIEGVFDNYHPDFPMNWFNDIVYFFNLDESSTLSFFPLSYPIRCYLYDSNLNYVCDDMLEIIPYINLAAGEYFLIIIDYWECGNFSLGINKYTESPISLSGIITDINSGAPIQNAEIVIPYSSKYSDENGYFQQMIIPADNYDIHIRKSNYMDFRLESIPVINDTSLTIELTPVQLKEISGFVYDANTNIPIENVVIKVYESSDDLSGITTSDESGFYEIENFFQNEYTIKFIHEDYITKEFNDVIITDSLNLNVTLETPEFCSISVSITDSVSGEPIENANVKFGNYEFLTSENGDIEVDGIIQGDYSFRTYSKDYFIAHDSVALNTESEEYSVELNECEDVPDSYQDPMYVSNFPFYHRNSIHADNDADYYRIYVQANQRVRVNIVTEYAEEEDYHYESRLQTVWGRDSRKYYKRIPINREVTDYLFLDEGIYYVYVQSSVIGNYNLTISMEDLILPPRDLTATTEQFTVNLEWLPPIDELRTTKTRNSRHSNRDFTGYRVYRDTISTPIAELPESETTFSETILTGGNHSYFVVAVYDNYIESWESNIVEVEIPNINAPFDLTAEIVNENVRLNWLHLIRNINDITRNKRRFNPITREVTGYNIYRNNEILAEVSGSDSLIFYDTNPPTSGEHSYFVKAVYFGEVESDSSNVVTVTFTENENDIPIITELSGNYPNPFNPETSIKYSMSKDDEINISIYNIKGQLVKTLIDEHQESGHHEVIWNGKDNKNKQTSSGVYFMKMETSEYKKLQKMLLMK